MTPEDREKALAAISSLPNRSSAYGRRLVKRLARILDRRPGDFWQAYLEEVNQPVPEIAALIRSGTVTGETKFGEMAAISQR